MKRIAAATAAIVMMASFAGPATAQKGGGFSQGGGHKTPLELQYERERKEQQENERAYNEHMKRAKSTTGPAAQNDPWAGVRPAETNARR
jgi:hypothetical protein